MLRRILLIASLLFAGSSAVHAQSSQFGVRGIGHPGRWASARTLATGGALGVFDGMSSQNPAALGQLGTLTSVFTASTTWRNVVNPEGDASARSARFPQVLVGGPVAKTPLALAFSYSSYADRDFTIASTGISAPRGTPVPYTDTLTSRGGVSDLRLAAAWAFTPRFAVGAGVDFLTGSNRLSTRRVFEDSSYVAAEQRAELSFKGMGFSFGFLLHPASGIAIAGSLRKDGSLELERDSTALPTRIDLPLTLMGGVRLRVRPGFDLAGQVTSRNWSTADDGIVANGAIGARNTFEASVGGEISTNVRRPGQRPLRFGARYAKLPFLLATEGQPSEWGVSVGTGMRFRPNSEARDAGGLDLTLERIQRKQGSAYTESAFVLSVGVTIFTGGGAP